ncbi:helix-turn-helix domain-containing protein [Clostridium sp. NSJ-145]|uniref:helix-turn-helix domain-containing protein n=1 Tax=Clostridium sp. NSJ-145 TaxID=2897777 RepID=UPI001E5F95C0|nr:helix-turn-helix domain-containing protein [Clostridium sp. NSJ-145]MCD2502516.1 helix-turn-helix domain-containing protein [Clostridium sp. NSJ-145]MDY3362202.1 helix-turn-helix domain-containing protein [Clostridium celatum]
MEKLLFSVKEVAEMLYVNKNKVYDLIKQGKLGYVDLGAKKIPKAEIDRFIRENITYSQR